MKWTPGLGRESEPGGGAVLPRPIPLPMVIVEGGAGVKRFPAKFN